MSPQDAANVRDWYDILDRVRFGSLPSRVRKGRSPHTIRLVAQRLARYADPDGTKARPGLVRLAAVLEMDYATTKDCVAVLRDLGLIRLVKASGRPGRSNEYELAVPAELLDRVDVWSPAQLELTIRRNADKTKGRYRSADPPRKTDLQGSTTPAGTSTDTEPAGVNDPCTPVEETHLQGQTTPADEAAPATPAGVISPPNEAPAGVISPDLQGQSAPLTYQRPLPNPYLPTDHDVRTAVTGPRARDPEQDPNRRGVGPVPIPWTRPTYPGEHVDPPEIQAARARRGRALVDAARAAHAAGQPCPVPDPPPDDADALAVVLPFRRPA